MALTWCTQHYDLKIVANVLLVGHPKETQRDGTPIMT